MKRPAIFAGVLLYIVLIYPVSWAFFYAVRFGLQLADWLGIMDKDRGLGGQLLGYNFYRHPVWVHWLIDAFAAAATHGLVLCGLMLAIRKFTGSGRATLCGACGANIERGGGLIIEANTCKCPACRTSIAHSGQPRISFHVLRRFVLVLLVLGIAHAILNKAFLWDLKSFFLSICEACGGDVERLSGRIATGSGGPFYGEGIMPWIYNCVYTYGPILTIEIASGLAGVIGYLIVAGPLGCSRAFGYRGPTLCGCGYEIASLTSPQCPECGRNL